MGRAASGFVLKIHQRRAGRIVMGKIGQNVLFVLESGETFAAIITAKNDEGVTLTYFPPGGGAHGINNVPHVTETRTSGAAYWKVK